MRTASNILVIIFSFIVFHLNGQFYGGTKDGFVYSASGNSLMMAQEAYCQGGTENGFSVALSPLTVLGGQAIYAYGGTANGFTVSASGLELMMIQDFYCMGGTMDGFGFSVLLLHPLNEQSDYCSGGQANGFSDDHSPLVPLLEDMIYSYGGTSDGFSSASPGYEIMNEQVIYCEGSSYNGFSFSGFFDYINDTQPYCSGGTKDGQASAQYDGRMFLPLFCFGGTGNGWNGISSGLTPVNLQVFYCTAGSGNGFAYSGFTGNTFGSYLFCFGGPANGFHSMSSGELNIGYGIWTGLSNSTWTTAGNWKYNTVPTVNTNVLIPAGAPNYPVMVKTFTVGSASGTYKCKRLDIQTGGQLTSSSFITVDGIVNISGILTFHKTTYNYLRINSTGEMNIKQGGMVNME